MDLAEISHLPFFVVGFCVDFFFSPFGSISGLAPHTADTKSLAGTVGGMGGSKAGYTTMKSQPGSWCVLLVPCSKTKIKALCGTSAAHLMVMRLAGRYWAVLGAAAQGSAFQLFLHVSGHPSLLHK